MDNVYLIKYCNIYNIVVKNITYSSGRIIHIDRKDVLYFDDPVKRNGFGWITSLDNKTLHLTVDSNQIHKIKNINLFKALYV
jgi:hypothetical protein